MEETKFRYWDSFNRCFTYSDSFRSLLNYQYKGLSDFFLELHRCEEGENKPVLEQWTGLLDKDDNEIYEGDIVMANGVKQIIDLKSKEKREGETYLMYLQILVGYGKHKKSQVRKLGNIHENPEL